MATRTSWVRCWPTTSRDSSSIIWVKTSTSSSHRFTDPPHSVPKDGRSSKSRCLFHRYPRHVRMSTAIALEGWSGGAQPVTDQTCGRIPSAVGIQNDHQEIAAVLGDFGDKTPSCFRGKAGFDAFNAGNSTEQTICRVQKIRMSAVHRHDHGAFLFHQIPENGLLQGDHA